jgi:glutathione synthase/RimK-type ligase-like ATP-grasp enzyme
MLVVLTNSQDATAAYLCSKLEQAEISFVRLDTDTLISRARISYTSSRPILGIDGQRYQPGHVEHIWYRRPEKLKDTRFNEEPEDQYTLREWSEGFENFFSHIPQERWMNHPSANAAASHKLQQLTVAADLGFNVPDTLVTQDEDELLEFFRKHDEQVIVKPLSTGYVERPDDQDDSLIYTNRVSSDQLLTLEGLSVCPTLFQQFVRKYCDVRITVVDEEVHAVSLFARDNDGTQRCDIRRYNMVDVKYEVTQLPANINSAISRLLKQYRLRFGAIDMAIDTDGRWYFFEINPNGQWAWLDLCGVTRIADSFIRSFKGQFPA